MNYKILFFIAFAAFSLQWVTSCGSCSRKEEFDMSKFKESDSDGQLKMGDKVMEDMVDNISSPIEMASLMKTLNVPFSQKYLATTKNVSTYSTGQAKAFNLGVFACDLGYLNMYGKVTLVLDYISAMMNLANGINVGQFFDYGTMKRIATNNQNIDSMVIISQQSFNKMDKYLQSSKRGHLSILMVAGVWIEGLYLTSRFYLERPGERRLGESIGEQKVMLDQLLLILGNFEEDRYIADVITELGTLKELFSDIKITVEIGEPKRIEIDGMLTIVQTETSVVNYTDEQMNNIVKQAEVVRNKLIQ